VLAAPLMDVSRMMDVAKLLSPAASNTDLEPAASAPPAEAVAPTFAPAALEPTPRGPPTPLLLAVGPSRPRMVPDLQELFSLYYPVDQTICRPPADVTQPKLATTPQL